METMRASETQRALQDLIVESAARHPEQECVVFDSGIGEPTSQPRVTYSQLWQKVTELKIAFESVLLKEEIVGVLLGDDVSIPSILVGLLCSSCAFQPLNIEGLQYTASALIKAGVSCILAHSELSQKISPLIKQLDGSLVLSDTLSKNGLQFFRIKNSFVPGFCPVKNFDLAYCITTSGTTSAPKVVHVPHSCIVPNVTDLREIFQLTASDRVLLTSPLTFDPSIIDIFCTLSAGACLVIVPGHTKRRPDVLLNILHNRQAVTVIQATPTLMKSFSPSKLKQTLLGPTSSLRVLALGGERFPNLNSLRTWLHPDNDKTQFYNLYGITEVSCWASCQHVDVRAAKDLDSPVPIGTALDQTTIKLMPVDGETGAVDSEGDGEIWIGSETRTCFIDNEVYEEIEISLGRKRPGVVWRNTRDRGKVLPDGSILCLGRMDDQVKRNGKRLNLEAVETVCKEVTGVLDCCAVLDQSNLIVFIVTELPPGNVNGLTTVSGVGSEILSSEHCKDNEASSFHAQDTSWAQLQQKLKACIEASLPSHYVPSAFVRMKGAFPRTQNGKRDTRLLVKIGNAEMKFSYGKDICNVWTHSQELWMACLPDASVNIDSSDNFLFLGGDSLAALRVVSSLEQDLKCSLPNLLDLLINKDFGCFVEELQSYVKLKSPGSPLSLLTPEVAENTRGSESLGETFNFEKLHSHQKKVMNKNSNKEQTECVPSVKSEQNLHERKMSKNKKAKLSGLMTPDEKLASSLDSSSVKYYRSSSDLLRSPVSSISPIRNLGADFHVAPERITPRVKRVASRGRLWQNKICNLMCSEKCVESFNSNGSKTCQGDVITNGSKTCHSDVITNVSKNCHSDVITNVSKNCQGDVITNVSKNCQSDVITNVSKNCQGDVITNVSKNCQSDVITNVSKNCMKLDPPDWDRLLNEPSGPTARTAVDLRLRWKFDTRKCVDASPLIVEIEEMVLAFIGSHSGQFSAINTLDGTQVWAVTLPDRIESSACCSLCGAYIIVGCYDGFIYVFDITSGAIAWTFATDGSVKCSPVVDEGQGYVVCGSHDGFLYCLDLNIKECVWKCHLGGGSVFSSPAIDVPSRLVYAASLAGQVLCINIDSGAVKWTTNLHKPVFSSLCLLGRSVLAGCVDGRLYCLSPSGHTIWTFQTQAPIFSTPIVHSSTPIMHSSTPTVHSSTPTVRSSTPTVHSSTPTVHSPTPTFHDSTIVVGSHDHHLYCLDKDGHQLWSFKASSPVYSTPCASKCVQHVKSHEALCSVSHHRTNSITQNLEHPSSDSQHGTNSQTHSCSVLQPGTNSQTHSCSVLQPGTNSQTHSCSVLQPGTNSQTHSCSVLQPGTNSQTHSCSDLQPGTNSQTHSCSVSQHRTNVPTHHAEHSPQLLTSVVITASTAGSIYLVNLGDGRVLKELVLPGEIFSSPVIVDNFVVTGCRDNYVYCWEITLL